MKLAYLINGLGAGGAERSLAELLPRYDAAGIDTTVVCLRHTSIGVESDLLRAGCRVEFLSGTNRIQWIRSMRRLLRRDRPHLVHTTLFDSHLVGRLAAAGTGVPVLSSLVNTPYDASRDGDRALNPLGFKAVRAIDRWTARHLTRHFHAITYAVRDAYVREFGLEPDRVTVVERGRDAGRLGAPSEDRRLRAREALGLSPSDEVLINVGRQEYQKGQPILLRAIAELLDRRPRLVLLVAGREGNLTPELQQLHSDLGLDDRVRFLGHRSDVPDLLAASDVFVFPSLFEGLGGAVLEAMALGLPVVASDIPALREVVEVGRSGDLVPVGSPTELARALDELLDSPERMTAYGARGRERFERHYGMERCAARMISLYHRVVDGDAPMAVESSSGGLHGPG